MAGALHTTLRRRLTGPRMTRAIAALNRWGLPLITVSFITIGFQTVVIVRPSFLVGARAQDRAGEAVALRISRVIQPLLVGPLRKYAAVDAIAVARTLVGAAATAPPGITIIESDAIR